MSKGIEGYLGARGVGAVGRIATLAQLCGAIATLCCGLGVLGCVFGADFGGSCPSKNDGCRENVHLNLG